METAYAIEHISKLGNVVVRAGCGEFEGERNVCVDVGLGHGYTETANTKSKEAFLETCIFYTHLEVISAPLRERSREEPEGCARAKAGVGPGGRFDSYNKHIQSLKELTCPSEKPHTDVAACHTHRPPGARQGTS